MKIILATVIWFSAFVLQAQTPTFIRMPLQMENGRFFTDCPVYIPSTNPPINTVTNYVFLTNYVMMTSSNRPAVEMTDTIIKSPAPGVDYVKVVKGPTAFTMGSLKAWDDVIIHIINVNSNRMEWPNFFKLPNGPLPTNSVRCWIWVKNVGGEIWASP